MSQEEEGRKRGSSVSYIRGNGGAKDNVGDDDDGSVVPDDEIHISLAPYIQTYLAHSGQGLGCCGVGLPVPFERAAPRSWWNPKFDSEILEGQYKCSSFPQIRLRFRYALTYILLISIIWLGYFVILGIEDKSDCWLAIVMMFGTVSILCAAILYLTYTDYYRTFVLPISVGVALMLCFLSILFLVLVPPYEDGLTLVGHFALCSEILLLIYTVLPLPLYLCVLICSLYSFLFEFFTAYKYSSESTRQYFSDVVPPPSVAVHSFNQNITFQRLIRAVNNTSSIVNSTIQEFLPLLMPNLESETNLLNSSYEASLSIIYDDVTNTKILIIRILMQICIHLIGVHILIMTFVRMRGTFMKVGQSLLVRRQLEMEKQLKEKMIHSVMPPKVADWLMEESEREREREDSLKKGSIPSNNTDIRSLFRPFNMHSMDDVSILFADIVGFTRMSSNKTAEELVGILNDLFERFDDLCEQHGCEKISTLGDCYYCVSGCPEPRPDHAKCCVEMGLAMIEAIKQFDIERREGVNMRVGVHTGTVLCGIVGTKRFKFDVWSNDVTLANKLESTGKPGRVHLSEKTLSFLNDQYLTEDGELVNGMKTYFIKTRKADFVSQVMNSVNAPTNVSPILQARHRLASCSSQGKAVRPHYLHMVTNASSYRMKANSLPSILDSDNDADNMDEVEDSSKSPSSTASYGKKKKLRPWRYLQRQRTTEEMSPLEVESRRNIIIAEANLGLPFAPTPPVAKNNGSPKFPIPVNNVLEVDMNPMPSSPLLPGQDTLSHASSICSRKDSGIRSNSRRSSIQQQLFLMNGMTQGDLLGPRVSGYYTSSSTLNSTHDPSSSVPPYPFPPAVTDTFGACFHKLRKQSDLQLIRCVQDNVTSQSSYFVKPPLSSVTLFFKNKEMEKEYRENAHKASEGIGGNPPTLATSRFNTYFDILISALVYTAIAISLFLLCKPTLQYHIFFGLAALIQIFAVTLCIRQLLNPGLTFAHKIFKFFAKWYPWHVCGAILVGLPIVSILMNFTCNNISLGHFEYYYSYLVIVALVHFCNFTQLNCWMKNFLATLTGIIFVYLVISHVYRQNIVTLQSDSSKELNNNFGINSSIGRPIHPISPLSSENPIDNLLRPDQSSSVMNAIETPTKSEGAYEYNKRLYDSEIYFDLGLLLLLVWFLNREFEISYRLSFHGNAVAARDKSRVQSMKNQADWLLHNIIPKYVADQLKTTAKYSQNHKQVGIIFASIVNFNELYDESYLGGKEYLRVLNELIGDFDELLEKKEYSNVEKIKTIGSTFMAASGLNPQVRLQSEHKYTHLYQLLEFAEAMHKVIYDFNNDLLGFKLILRVGFNYGDVTAGVIGATKLYYDIWGDAVNIASRMDSTGVAGEIQFASNCLDVVSLRYNYEPRGQVYVKGKDDMNVFLLKGKRS
ncbi:adenylate cyclase type 9 [Phymastichus coffea]|uniref:adenylate cyclase type 9 n=1 Tax=Phymastichus coffea TaxID=108790 RepID=UPI00273BC6C0|nr:adenylate cyclase type 9 [Phymastichus coffea]